MYNITFKKSDEKEIYKLPSPLIKRVSLAIDKLAQNPRPTDVIKIIEVSHRKATYQ